MPPWVSTCFGRGGEVGDGLPILHILCEIRANKLMKFSKLQNANLLFIPSFIFVELTRKITFLKSLKIVFFPKKS